MEFSRRDLAALNIMRGRDSGLPDYNTARKCYGLDKVATWEEINPLLASTHPEIFLKMSELYSGDLGNVDVFVAGLLESVDGPGPLFSTIIKEQFTRYFEMCKSAVVWTNDSLVFFLFSGNGL